MLSQETLVGQISVPLKALEKAHGGEKQEMVYSGSMCSSNLEVGFATVKLSYR